MVKRLETKGFTFARMETRGFTLVELVVVIAIVGILASQVINAINTSGIRAKTRDSQRIADLKTVQTALELYFSENRNYPPSDAGTWMKITGEDSVSSLLEAGYINAVPADPVDDGSNDACDHTTHSYVYWSSGASYILAASMEVETSNDDAPCAFCPGTEDTCYEVKNP